MEKELINNLDLFDCSKELFLSNIKVLKKYQKICKRKIKEINQCLTNTIRDSIYNKVDSEYLNTVKDCYTNLLINIESSLKYSNGFINSTGTDKETLLCFYKSLYKIYLEEGSNT